MLLGRPEMVQQMITRDFPAMGAQIDANSLAINIYQMREQAMKLLKHKPGVWTSYDRCVILGERDFAAIFEKTPSKERFRVQDSLEASHMVVGLNPDELLEIHRRAAAVSGSATVPNGDQYSVIIHTSRSTSSREGNLVLAHISANPSLATTNDIQQYSTTIRALYNAPQRSSVEIVRLIDQLESGRSSSQGFADHDHSSHRLPSNHSHW